MEIKIGGRFKVKDNLSVHAVYGVCMFTEGMLPLKNTIVTIDEQVKNLEGAFNIVGSEYCVTEEMLDEVKEGTANFKIGDTETIKGYSGLSTSAKILFKAFLINFMNAQGTNSRESLLPISVEYVDGYFRFDYKRHGRKYWLHVAGAHTWY